MDDLFTIETPKLRINANTITVYDYPKGYPYVVRTSQNNGIRGYIEFDEKYLNPANTISFGQDTATMFYQERPYFTGDKIKILTLKCDKLNHRTAVYLLTSMRKAFSLFAWGQSKFNVTAIGEVKFYLPILCDSESKNKCNLDDIDWDYMQDRIRELEQDRIRELELYLKATGLSSYVLTDEDRTIIEKYRNISKNFGGVLIRFKIGDLFSIIKGKRLTRENQTTGNTPFIGSTENNNGITSYIGQAPIYKENAISVSYNGSVGQAFYQEKPFWASDDINVLYLNGKKLNSLLFGYLGACLKKSGKAFSYTQKWNLERMKSSDVVLPICFNNDGTPTIDPNHTYHSDGYIPDFDYMEKYIRAMQKMVIADVVKYKDSVIAQTRKVVI